MTLNGLVEVLNRNLLGAHRFERVFWSNKTDPNSGPSTDQEKIEELEELIKIGDPFGPFNKAKGGLDRKKLADQINHGSVYDLIYNLSRWAGNPSCCYTDGISIGGGNWPYLPGGHLYPLEFK